MSLAVKRVTSSCMSFRHICDGPLNAEMYLFFFFILFCFLLLCFVFFTKKQTRNVVGEKSRKGRGLIKHQGKKTGLTIDKTR